MRYTIQNVILILIIGFIDEVISEKPTTIPRNTTRNGSYASPSNFYIISVVLIGIILLILFYFCINDTTRHAMIALLYWVFLLIVKIIMFIPAILALLYCYIYKAFVFICKKIKNKLQIEVELQNSVVDFNTGVTTDTSTDTTTDMTTETIGFILYCYSCSGLMYPFSRN